MMERVTMIHADQWELVAEDVKAGRCEVTNPLYDYAISHIKPIKLNSVGWAVRITDTEGTYRTRSSVELTVRWLAPAPASEQEAGEPMDNHDLKIWALSNVDNPAVLAAIDRLITENANARVDVDHYKAITADMDKSLQTIGAALGLSGKFKDQFGTDQIEQAVKTIMEDREFITDIRNLCMKAQDERNELRTQNATLQAELTTTRQKLAAAGDSADKAVERAERDHLLMHEAQVEADRLRSEMQEALACLRTSLPPLNFPYPSQQAFLDEMRHQAARVLDKALQATPQPAPSDLRAAVATALTDLEAIATGMTGDLTPANVANIALDKLATALKAGE